MVLVNEQVRQLVMQSWKERWNEERWSCQVRHFISSPSESLQLADALVSQAFVGPTPNALLIRNVLVCLNNSLITYASVINAISKHDELMKVESTRSMYKLLHKLLRIINSPGKQQISEDSMTLCGSLRIILKWLLRNAETFFDSELDSLTELSCAIIDELTTQPRTSALLTIARFEESGPWSNIETDLAVIKNSANGSAFSAKINATCHHVSQVSRRSIEQKPCYVDISKGSLVCPSVLMVVMLEVEEHRLSDPHSIVRQLSMLGKICGLEMWNLLFSLFSSCLLCLVDVTEERTQKDWLCMVFYTLPRIVEAFNTASVESDISSENTKSSSSAVTFQHHLSRAISKLNGFENLLDSVDQLRSDLNFIEIFTTELNRLDLLTEEACRELQEQRNVQRVDMSPNDGYEHCISPNLALKAHNTVGEVLHMLDNQQMQDPEQLFTAFQSLFAPDNLEMLVAAAAASGSLKTFASSLLRFNSFVRNEDGNNSGGETSKQAYTRTALYDVTFLTLAHLVRVFGSAMVFDDTDESSVTSYNNGAGGGNFVKRWTERCLSNEVDDATAASLNNNNEPLESPQMVDLLLNVLTTRNDDTCNTDLLATVAVSRWKWDEVCANLGHAFFELVRARQRGIISEEEVERACRIVRDQFPLTCVFSLIVDMCRHSNQFRIEPRILDMLTSGVDAGNRNIPLSHTRNFVFTQLVAAQLSECQADASAPNAIELFDQHFKLSIKDGWVSPRRLVVFKKCLKLMGLRSFVDRTCERILHQVGLSVTRNTTDIAYSLVSIQPEPMTIYLLRYFVPQLIRAAPHRLVEPSSGCLARLLVANLDFALNEAFNRQKTSSRVGGHHGHSVGINDQPAVDPFLFDPTTSRAHTSCNSNILDNNRMRRMLSCSTEHDLAPSGLVGLSPNEPLVVILNDFIRFLSASLCNASGKGGGSDVACSQKGTRVELAFNFVRFTLRSSPLLSRTMKELMQSSDMLKCIGYRLTMCSNGHDHLDLLFAASDLGDSNVRRIASDIVLFSEPPPVNSGGHRQNSAPL